MQQLRSSETESGYADRNSHQEDGYLTIDSLDFFRSRLLRWRRELTDKLSNSLRPSQPMIDNQGDWVDVATQSTQVEMTRAEQHRISLTIRDIDSALQRIKDGTYGYCAETGEEIGLNRLRALPTARLSIAAQDVMERRKRAFA